MKSEKIIIAIILGIALLGYSLIGRQTKLDLATADRVAEEEEASALRSKEIQKQNKLNTCISKATSGRRSWWKNSCENFGSNLKKNGDGDITSCSLPSYIADNIHQKEKEDKDRCVKLYQ